MILCLMRGKGGEIVNMSGSIRMLRALRGISQKGLSSMTGLDPSYISLLESGNREPSMASGEKIADAFGVSFYFLYLLACGDSESDDECKIVGKTILKILSSHGGDDD